MRYIILGTIILFHYFIHAQPLTLSEAEKIVLEKHPAANAADLELDRQSALKKASFDLPKTEVTLQYGQYNSINKNDNNITISQGIPFPTVFSSQKAVANARIKGATLDKAIVENELRFQVRTLFNNILYTNAIVETWKSLDSLAQQLQHIATRQYAVGEGTLLEKTMAESQTNTVTYELKNHELEKQRLLRELQLLCQLTEPKEVSGDFENMNLPLSRTESVITNLYVQKTGNNVDLSVKEKKLLSASTLPEIRVGYFNQTLIGTQTVNGEDVYFNSSKRFDGFIVGVSFPLFYNASSARLKAAKLSTQAAEKQYDQSVLTSTIQIRESEMNKKKAEEKLNFLRTSGLPSSDLLLKQSSISYKAGEISLPIFIQNIKQSISVRLEYLSVMKEYNQSAILLEYLNASH